MSEWEQPHRRLLIYNESSATGRDLGVINRKYFEPATWESFLSTEVGRDQYGKFVASMIERIRIKESSYDEIRSFVHLVSTEHNWNFLKVAMPYLPELKERYPHDSKNFEIALLFLLKPKIRRRSIKEIQNTIPAPNTYNIGLSKEEEQLLRHNLFGPISGAVESLSMSRLFRSTLELGYPQPALDQSMREAEERGTDIERCYEGLPMNILMPDAMTRHEKVSSSSHSHRPEVWIQRTSVKPSRVQSPSAIICNEPSASPPRELLTKLAVDGVDPPGPTTSVKMKTSRGAPLKRNGTEGIEGFLDRRAESPNHLQVSCDEPPRTRDGPAEREAFKAYYKEPASVFLNYFHILERVPDPPKPEPDTKRQDCTIMSSTPGRSPFATPPKPSQTAIISVGLSKRDRAQILIA